MDGFSKFEDYGLENWQWIVGINFMGVVNGCHFFIPVMKQQQSEHIINIFERSGFKYRSQNGALQCHKSRCNFIERNTASGIETSQCRHLGYHDHFFQNQHCATIHGAVKSRKSLH